jgi:hypothetical protein
VAGRCAKSFFALRCLLSLLSCPPRLAYAVLGVAGSPMARATKPSKPSKKPEATQFLPLFCPSALTTDMADAIHRLLGMQLAVFCRNSQ